MPSVGHKQLRKMRTWKFHKYEKGVCTKWVRCEMEMYGIEYNLIKVLSVKLMVSHLLIKYLIVKI